MSIVSSEKNRCIVLVGMPGSGKTTVGRDLAKRLGLEAPPHELIFREPGEAQEERVFLVGGQVFGSGREQQERFHEASSRSVPRCTDAMCVVIASRVAATAGLRGPSSRATAQYARGWA